MHSTTGLIRAIRRVELAPLANEDRLISYPSPPLPQRREIRGSFCLFGALNYLSCLLCLSWQYWVAAVRETALSSA